MANNRIEGGIAAIQSAGFATLAEKVKQKMATTTSLRQSRAQIEKDLSLGGNRGGIRKFKSASKTDRRALARGVILTYHVLKTTGIAELKQYYKDKSEQVLKDALKALDVDSNKGKSAGAPMMSKMINGKEYKWLKQQTHTENAITDAAQAISRGWVQETALGVPTGRYVAEDGGDSCGPTCCAMAYYYITGRNWSEKQMRDMAATHPQGYHAGGVGTGTFEVALADALNKVGHGVGKGWAHKNVPPNANFANWIQQKVSKKTPVIFNVGWHFVLGVEVKDGDLIVLDPWSGPMAVPLANLPDYPTPGKQFNGWVVVNDAKPISVTPVYGKSYAKGADGKWV